VITGLLLLEIVGDTLCHGIKKKKKKKKKKNINDTITNTNPYRN